MPLSVVAYIAPKVIQRFSEVERLTNQTLDPFMSSSLKDMAQQHEDRLAHTIEIEAVMIGTSKPTPGETRMQAMLKQLRLRQLAIKKQKTFVAQQEAADGMRAA